MRVDVSILEKASKPLKCETVHGISVSEIHQIDHFMLTEYRCNNK